MLFRCEAGHEWEANPSDVYHKESWCRFCNPSCKKNEWSGLPQKVRVRLSKRLYDHSAHGKSKSREQQKAHRERAKAAGVCISHKARRAHTRGCCLTCTIGKNLRTRVHSELRRAKLGLRLSGVRNLGCSIEEFKSYIEALWEPGMSWENHGIGPGTWQIDHIRNMASFDLTDQGQVEIVCHFLNQRPLWHEEHAVKSAEELRRGR